MKTVFISCDLEGISGVVHGSQTGPGQADEYARARRLMTGQVNAAVEGALAAGAELAIVNDSHGGMRNILIEELHQDARLITGSPKPLGMMQGVETGVVGAFFVGYHSRAGTPGVLNHTFSSRTVAELCINGRPAGEILANAAVAGYFGVPVLLVAGDSEAAAEASAVLPGVETAVTKEPLGRYSALCLPVAEANQRLRRAAGNALSRLGEAKPLVLSSPVTLTLRFVNTAMAEAALMIPGVARVDALTVSFAHGDYLVAYKAARAMMSLAFGVDTY